MHIVPKENAPQLLKDQNQPKRQKHLLEMVAVVQAREQGRLEDDADQQNHRQFNWDRQPDVADVSREPKRQISANHVEAPVGQIENAHDPEDQGQPAGEQEQQQPVLDAVEELNEKFQ